MRYHIHLSLPAKKQLDRLDQETVRRLRDRPQELAFDPHSLRLSKAITMQHGHRTSRVGDWCIIYRVNEKDAVLDIVAIRPRSGAYR